MFQKQYANGWKKITEKVVWKLYSQFTSCVISIFEIWTEFWNLHDSFEHRQQDFRVPIEISLVHWW